MGNKDGKKRVYVICIIWMLVLTVTMLGFGVYGFRECERNYNVKLNRICEEVLEKTDDISANDMMRIINSNDEARRDFLGEYGMDIQSESAILENQKEVKNVLMVELLIAIIGATGLVIILRIDERKREREITTIAGYIEQINRGNYNLKIDDNCEGDLSILKNEVYKTMVMLKEAADKSLKDKEGLKDSLSDISHQLKTPITSLMINLENLEDLEAANSVQQETELRREFISNVRRDVNRISTLVQAILKLSKFDSNTIEFVRKKVKLDSIVLTAYESVEALADLRDIKLSMSGETGPEFVCDAYWQTEALTNLMKNAIEHAESFVKVYYESNKVYQMVSIENDGDVISEKDMRHIFERFYRGENASKESLGIGLALAKTIIEKDGGYVVADSGEYNNKGKTVFTVKYL